MGNKKNIAIIPIRKGSKAIKNKNIKKLNGKPLFYYSLSQALKSSLFEKIIIASDSEKYFIEVKKNFRSKKIEYFKRNPSISGDYSATEETISSILKIYSNYDNCFLIQATSIFQKSQDLKSAYNVFLYNELDSLFSSCNLSKFIWSKKKQITPINYDYKNRPMRQKFKKKEFCIENGAFYIFKIRKYLRYHNRLFGKIGTYEMSDINLFEIDDKFDFKICDFIVSSKLF